ncbi:MAG: hypothetical protein ACI9Y7_000199 [Dokdonia sp.]|jgi:hypothetical protein
MITIDQNSAITSLNNALVPSSCLIDSRSEIDRLSFLAKFASLINFYDQTNKVNGDWSPFLLKDPIFLIASIATTPFHEKYLKYIKVSSECTKKIINPRKLIIEIRNLKKQIPTLEKDEKFKAVIDNLIKIKEKKQEKLKIKKIPIELVEVLFEQILNVFRTLQLWTYYLGKSEEVFNLKRYVFDEVKRFYSKLLWGILSFKEYLFFHFPEDKIMKVDWSSFQSFDKELWQLNSNKTPFWVLFGFKDGQYPDKENIFRYYKKLIELGDQLFSFFNTIIEYSLVEYSLLKTKKDKFPDTTLLRTFTKLLERYKNQLNGLSSKHLDFYYRDILKQQKKVASADSVFVCTDLVVGTSIYNLPEDTLFLAGDYEDTTPILFSNEKSVSINPAAIDKVYTLSKINDTTETDVFYKLNLTAHSDVSVVKKNEDDIVEGWKTFGSSVNEESKEITLGFAFASPILLLQEGTRTITIVFTLKDDVVYEELFKQAQYYLSTASDWFDITKISDVIISGKTVTITIILDEFAPPIIAFAKAKDGVESAWPMCKLVFSKFKTVIEAPKLTSLYIGVDVKGLKTFQLYNDFGQLETKKPFQLFGPTPAIDQSFIIGSDEIFSKKVETLDIQLCWDNLPKISEDSILDNFSEYYEKYNNFIKGDYKKIDKDTPILDWVRGFMAGLAVGLKLAGTDDNESVNGAVEKEIPFNNEFFKVNFQLLQFGDWVPVVMDTLLQDDQKQDEVIVSIPPPIPLFQESIPDSDVSTEEDDTITPEKLKPYSSFKYVTELNTQKEIDPTIQKDILEFSDTSTSGFLKMQLTTDPPYGFGLLLYPKVINAIALYNAGIIAKLANDGKGELIDAPNEPYTPTVNLFTGDYTSCVTYTFDEKKNTYPLDCFYYDTFCNYKIYDSQQGYLNPTEHIAEKGISIHKNVTNNGTLFIALTDLIAPAEVSFYFELTSTANKAVTDTSNIIYSYLSIHGWKPLEVLSDETYGFSCSGIIIFNIPDDITKDSHTVPESGTSYYISISVQDDLATYPETTFLKTNGMKLKRVDTKHILMTDAPFINADSILTTLNGVAEITDIVQPFSSFGGVAADNDTQMERRISTRLKTKDRLVSKTDYYRVIKENFPSIYYVIPSYNKRDKSVKIYVLNMVKSSTDANAYKPYVTICKRLEIKNFIETMTPFFKEIQVLNFEFLYIRVNATISIKNGNEVSGVKKILNPQINTFLSPWITTNQEQIKIGNGIDAAQIALFIKSQTEIASVKDVFIEIGRIDPITKKIKYPSSDSIKNQSSKEDNILFVPSLDNSKINYSW